MPQLLRPVLWLCVAMLLAIGLSAASAADRKMSLLPGNDLPGGDYSVLKQTTLKACEQACIGDTLCQAFTFNQKASWCFLKSRTGTPVPFAGATSGRIEAGETPAETAKARLAELPFPPQFLLDPATAFAAGLAKSDPAPKGTGYDALVKAGDDAAARSNPDGAMASYRQALGLNDNDPAVWLKLSRLAQARAQTLAKQNDGSSGTLADVGVWAALDGFLRTRSVADRATALGVLADALTMKQMWNLAIVTYRASLRLVDDAGVESRLADVVAQHGFRVTSTNVDADSASPRVCAVFSSPLPGGKVDLSGYVSVADAPKIALDVQQSQICLTGVQHGLRYHIRIRAGLPAADGESLLKDVDLNVYVPNRAPFVGFANDAYVLPEGLGAGLPITSVNATAADLVIYRIGDRAIADAVRNGVFGGSLDQYSAETVADQYGEVVWKGTVTLAKGDPNAMLTTAIPVNDALKTMQPGAYVVTATVAGVHAGSDSSASLATQWFVVTDLGLTDVSGDDGIHAFVRSLKTAKPVAGAAVRLIAVNNEILGEAKTDANGEATFAPGLARGDGGRAPQLIVAETDGGDYSLLDVSKSAFDLTDRGNAGRPSPGPLDVFATSERGVYRPGETVYLTALLRDANAKAVTGVPLTVDVQRPDGVVASHQVLKDQGAGGYFVAVPLVASAMRGSWVAKFYADPKAAPLKTVNFLVEDFEPDRLAFTVDAPKGPITPGQVTPIKVAAKYLYGATAPGLAVQADTIVSAGTTLAGFPGYIFGRLDDNFQTDRQSLGTVGTTDDAGNAEADVTLPAPAKTTKPLAAQIVLTLVDTNGRTIVHTVDRPVLARTNLIGVKPKFDADDGLPQGGTAGFDVVAVNPQGQAIAAQGLAWTLSRVDTNYQWYKENGVWKWEAVTTTRRVASGTVDTAAAGTGTLSATVQEGRYELEVDSSGPDATSTTYQFDAGYYYPVAGSDTPDKLKVALDKQAYRPGDTAHLRLDPQFAGTAVVMVVAGRVIAMQSVEVPAGGVTVDLPVTDDWSPGAYVTATLYRPEDAAAKRMPNRALGLAYAPVDPGDRRLAVSLDAPAIAQPRQSFSTTIKLGNVAAGTKAYVAVAAVDLGILNLTNFPVPNPDGYFFGQRQMGVEFRDLYGQLINPMQGAAGALRSGGDMGAPRRGAPPPTAVLVALDSGVVTVGADGTATVSFAMPDFSGTVRLMAMAWTDSAVGHASRDVIVRDPVVVTLSPPEFLRVGDTSRLLVEINNVSGPAGVYKVGLTLGPGLSSTAADNAVTLSQGARAALNLPLTGTALGDVPVTLTVTGPTGVTQVKELKLGVRAPSAEITRAKLITLKPGATVTLDKSNFAGMLPHTADLLLGVGSLARLDVPDLLAELDRYPYGCSEQITSRAMPLLYLNDVAETIGLGDDKALAKRIKDAIATLLANQTSSGAFGLWGPSDDSDDLWLDSYVTDFLLRARENGYQVPQQPLTMALDNLGNQVSAAADFDRGGEAIAYALYDLAKAGKAAIGDLRYYYEAKLDNFATPLAQAQLGAALSMYGDRARAAKAFAAALAGLGRPDNPYGYRTDYGSRLRDTAGVLALAAETSPPGVDLGKLTQKLADLRDLASYTSTQEDAWTLLAAAGLTKTAENGSITIDGKALTGAVYRRYDQEHFDGAPVVLTNNGNMPTEAKVSVTGIPVVPPPAANDGFAITRQYYDLAGNRIDPSEAPVHQNDRFVVVIGVTVSKLGSGQYVVNDPLPAGFSIENPDLTSLAGSNGGGADDNSADDSSDNSSHSSGDDSGDSSGDQTAALGWLSVDTPSHSEARTDAYVATFAYSSQTASFTTAYMVRATTPGSFVLPGATVEDMYRPELRGNTASGKVEVAPPAP